MIYKLLIVIKYFTYLLIILISKFQVTGTKDVPLKTTGHKKVRASVCLTAKRDGTKLKPFIVFAGAKRESKSLHKEFKSGCSVASSMNGWMKF